MQGLKLTLKFKYLKFKKQCGVKFPQFFLTKLLELLNFSPGNEKININIKIILNFDLSFQPCKFPQFFEQNCFKLLNFPQGNEKINIIKKIMKYL